MDKKVIPRYNSAAFTHELHDRGWNLADKSGSSIAAIRLYGIGWCYTSDTAAPNGGGEIAIMFEDVDGEKSWFHCNDELLEDGEILKLEFTGYKSKTIT